MSRLQVRQQTKTLKDYTLCFLSKGYHEIENVDKSSWESVYFLFSCLLRLPPKNLMLDFDIGRLEA